MYVTFEPPLAPAYGPARRVGGDHAHLLGRKAERRSGDRREAGVDAGHVRRARDHRHRPVGVDAADGGGRLVAARPVAGGDADALVVGQAVARRPELVLLGSLDHLDGAERRDGAGDAGVPLDERVLPAELERIEPELGRELVDQRLDGERRRRRPGPR